MQVALGIASSGVLRVDLMTSLASEMMCREGFSLQAIANIFWAFKTLNLSMGALKAHLEGLVARRLIQSGGICAREDVDSLLGILWANENEVLAAAITSSLQCLGRKMDGLNGSHQTEIPSSTGEGPQILSQVPGAIVIVKPQDWEVDTVCTAEDTAEQRGKKISAFIDGLNLRCKQGFVGRLDTPSSGLLLHATSFEGLFMLQVQRELGLLERDYLVLCHNWLPLDLSQISVKLRRIGRKAEVSPHGRPACTLLKLVAHLTSDFGQAMSFLALRIQTGRMHQIRSHLAHVGHPVVGDRRYGTNVDQASTL